VTSILRHPHATALTIAGSDPSGGAGLQADLKTFQQLGVYGMSVVTLLTVQNTQQVSHVEVLSPRLVRSQLDAVLADIPPQAIKIGALGNADVVQVVADGLRNQNCPVVVDPVLVSKHGHPLVTDDVVQAYRERLLPQAFVVTPNRFEAERLTGIPLHDDDAVAQTLRHFIAYGVQHVLIKQGEVNGQSQHWYGTGKGNQEIIELIQTPRLTTNNTHGTGCVLSAAITACLACRPTSPREAIAFGLQRTLQAIECNTRLGQGIHPAETRAMEPER